MENKSHYTYGVTIFGHLITDSLLRILRERQRENFVLFFVSFDIYRQTSNIRSTLAGNKIVDHWDVIGASFAGAAPTTSSFST